MTDTARGALAGTAGAPCCRFDPDQFFRTETARNSAGLR
ncbi:hypothetical protein BURMUCF2_1161 [Burkholderia multivorans CF2]|nr:hypothetical protein BURMUCF2_1161 [Burkholderia multivorans CF2]